MRGSVRHVPVCRGSALSLSQLLQQSVAAVAARAGMPLLGALSLYAEAREAAGGMRHTASARSLSLRTLRVLSLSTRTLRSRSRLA